MQVERRSGGSRGWKAAPQLLLLLAVTLSVACGSVAGSRPSKANVPPASKPAAAAAAAGQHLENVTLRLSFLVSGYADPYVLAKQNGYYKDAGLNVRIVEGKGSAITAQVVGNGRDQFGLVGASDAALLVTKGVPIKVLGVFIQRSPMAFIHHAAVQIKSPRDLIGKQIITTAGSAALQMLPVVLGASGLQLKDLKGLQMVQPTGQAAAFLKSKNAVILGFTTGNYPVILKADPHAVATPYADFGFHLYDSGLVTNLNEIKLHPNLVRRFVAASIRGWQAAQRDPEAAVRAAVKEFPQANASVQKAGLLATLKLLHTKNSQGHPIGWMAAADWRNTLHDLERYADLKHPKPLDTYYTNAFLPAQK